LAPTPLGFRGGFGPIVPRRGWGWGWGWGISGEPEGGPQRDRRGRAGAWGFGGNVQGAEGEVRSVPLRTSGKPQGIREKAGDFRLHRIRGVGSGEWGGGAEKTDWGSAGAAECEG
jgi:hypothetical protein